MLMNVFLSISHKRAEAAGQLKSFLKIAGYDIVGAIWGQSVIRLGETGKQPLKGS